jgi:hypothetical protein
MHSRITGRMKKTKTAVTTRPRTLPAMDARATS